MAPFNLRWYEEAGDPLDYLLQKELSEDYPASHAMATGENLFSMQDARNLIRYGGMVRTPRHIWPLLSAAWPSSDSMGLLWLLVARSTQVQMSCNSIPLSPTA